MKYNETLLYISPDEIEIAPDPPGLCSKGRSTQDSLSHKPACFSQALIRIVPDEEISGLFVDWVIKFKMDVP